MINKKIEVVLGSGSKRRQDILKSLGISFRIDIPDIEEVSNQLDSRLICEDIARKKLEHINRRIEAENILSITGDTIVCLDDKIYGKPKSRQDAISTLKSLSGKTHHVITSIGIGFSKSEIQVVNSEITEVTFFNLDENSINHYLDHQTYMDKAGAYAIQDPNCYFVSKINGSLTNVIGLPIELLDVSLKKIFTQKYGRDDWKSFI